MSSEEVKALRVPEVMTALEGMNRIRSEEAEFQFYTINSAFNGSKEFVDELKKMRMTAIQRKHLSETQETMSRLGFNVKLR